MAKHIGMMAVAIALLAAPEVAAQEGASGRVLDSFGRCRSIPDAAARLACFDEAAAVLEASVKAKDIRIVDRSDVRKARRSLFGLNVPDLGVLGGADSGEREAFTEINTTVRAARAAANGRAEITLADEGAAVWQTTDPMPFPPKSGAKIRIRKGAMGAFFLNVEGRSYRAMRLR